MLKLKKNIMRKSFEKLWSDENVSLNSHVLPYRKRYFIGQNASRGWTCSLCSKSLKQEDIRKMESYKREFIEFMVDCNVLRFGEFTLKSGRKSPFFMNAGLYVTGAQ